MSIQSEINRISGNVQDTISAIQATGVPIPSGANSDDLPALAQALANEKQDKLTGQQGQYVGFDSNGAAVATSKPTYTASEVGARPSTWTPTASEVGAIPATEKGAASGVATLGTDGKLTPAQAYYLLLSVSAAAAYSAAATYEQGDFCTYQGQLYKANQDIGTAEAWTAAHWTATSIMAEVAALIGALDYDPGGTANTAVSQHNTDPAAHADIRAAMVTATAQISYNQGGAA